MAEASPLKLQTGGGGGGGVKRRGGRKGRGEGKTEKGLGEGSCSSKCESGPLGLSLCLIFV